jgi:hypothetical protein
MLIGIGIDGRPTYEGVGREALAKVLGRHAGAG